MSLELHIEDKPFDKSTELTIRKLVKEPGSFGEMGKDKENQILNKLKSKNIIVTVEQLRSIRSAIIKEHILFRYTKIKNMARKLYQQYRKDMSLQDLAVRYDFPALGIARQFLLLKYSKGKVKEMMKDPDTISNDKLKADVKYVIDNRLDLFITADQADQAQYAMDYEEHIGNYLTDNNVKFKTQEELSDIQISESGRAICTPDFLLVTPTIINGAEVKWIDAKNFYGAKTFMISKSIEKQIKKYVNAYGSGSIFFSQNYSIELRNTINKKFGDTDILFVNFPKVL
jgi:hypothetical protein